MIDALETVSGVESVGLADSSAACAVGWSYDTAARGV